MQTKFQNLNLEKFSSASIDPKEIYGGANAYTNENLPDGGATCDTGGGTATWGDYNSDTQAYDGNGNLSFKEYHVSQAAGGSSNS